MNCIFCKIVRGEIPSQKIAETALSYCFLDINPLSVGHVLVIPKEHAQFLHELTDESLRDLLPLVKHVSKEMGQYNILQNNGRMAGQVVDHVHFHCIPKTPTTGLKVEWSPMK
jgi:diadenosine tetraphosphate (Ap4A) HIT family hydrolase